MHVPRVLYRTRTVPRSAVTRNIIMTHELINKTGAVDSWPGSNYRLVNKSILSCKMSVCEFTVLSKTFGKNGRMLSANGQPTLWSDICQTQRNFL